MKSRREECGWGMEEEALCLWSCSIVFPKNHYQFVDFLLSRINLLGLWPHHHSASFIIYLTLCIIFLTSWFFIRQWWNEAKCKANLLDLINEFISADEKTIYNHIAKFRSYRDKLERWDRLGINKDEFFEVDIDIFKDHILNILKDKELNNKNFF